MQQTSSETIKETFKRLEQSQASGYKVSTSIHPRVSGGKTYFDKVNTCISTRKTKPSKRQEYLMARIRNWREGLGKRPGSLRK